MLDVRGLSVRLDGENVLTDVSLRVQRGETCALLGPSGCGKSTLLRSIAGLVTLTHGTVSVAGVDQAGVPVNRRGIGLMFQDHALFPHLTVAGNVAFGLRMHGVDAARRDARVHEVLELVGLGALSSRRVASLSGGERQRVALARTLAPKPELLLLDEPLGALDRRLRDRLLDELPELFARTDTTVVYVTHDYSEAERLASTIAVMADGQIDRHASPAGLWRDPQSVFTATFIDAGPVWTTQSSAGIVTPFGVFGDVATPGVLIPTAQLRLVTGDAGQLAAAHARVRHLLFRHGQRYATVAFDDGVTATVACPDADVIAGDTVTVACDVTSVTVLNR